jgi:hypothetical protein
MAGDWIKMRTTLWTAPEVVRIVSASMRPPAHVIGALHYLWSTFDAHSSDGSLTGMPPGTFDSATEFDGFEGLMVDVGWLVVETVDGVTHWKLPRYEEHNGPTAKRRAQEQKRKRNAREGVRMDADQRRGEERREDVKKKKKKKAGDTPAPPSFDALEVAIPGPLQTGPFLAAWSDWVQHRREIKKKLTPLAVTKQLKRLASMGESRARTAIEHTIEKGWTGLREPEGASAPAETIDVDAGVRRIRRKAAEQAACAAANPLGPMAAEIAGVLKYPEEK